MSTEYAGSLFDTEHEAQTACVHDWLTAYGDTPTVQALRGYWGDPEALAYELRDDMDRGGWVIPGEVDPDGGIEDLLEDWEKWARADRLREIRVDELGMGQEDFARMLSIAGGQQAISKYERGVIVPSRQTVMLAEMMAEEMREG